MLGVRSFSLVLGALAFCTVVASRPATTCAASIDLSLNVFFTNPSNQNSGGTWELVAKSSDFGISAVNARINNIAGGVNRGPRAIVNGNDPAGFSIFADSIFPGYHNIVVAQAPLFPLGPGEEQNIFYGVGTLQNGAPNYPAKPAGSNSIGPAFTSLQSPTEIPWALNVPMNTGDWVNAARLVSGTFAAGVTPAFVAGSTGQVFSTTPPALNNTFTNPVAATITSIVRTNFVVGNADYNNNGIVDAADYVLWRNANGTSVSPGTSPDGNGDGLVNNLDYDLWRSHFGLASGAGSGGSVSTGAIPEPATFGLLLIGALAFSLTFARFPRQFQPVTVPVYSHRNRLHAANSSRRAN
jgi:hypothetical protein